MDDITPPSDIVNPPEGRGDTERGLEGDPPIGVGIHYISIGYPPCYLIPYICTIFMYLSYNKYSDYI